MSMVRNHGNKLEAVIMKKSLVSFIAVASLAIVTLFSCSDVQVDNGTPNGGYTIQIPARSTSTKAVNDKGAPSFKTSENVYLYNNTTSTLETAVLHPKSNAAQTHFVGTLVKSYSVNDELKVLYNTSSDGIVDYSSQDGSIDNVIDAGTGIVTITDISADRITTSGAALDNLQSIFKFTFKCGGNEITGIRFVRIFSTQNKLATQYNAITGATTYGPVTVSRSTNLADNYIYAGLRFDANDGDDIVFQLFDADGKAYSGSKTVPDGGFTNGNFYNTTVNVHLDAFTANASGKKVCFSPGDYGANNTFSEPFVGIGSTSYYFNESTCQAAKTVAGVEWRIPEDGIDDWEMWYIVGLGGSHPESRTMNGNASRYYKVYIDKSVTINSVTTAPTCCLLIPPDDAVLSDAEKTELSNAVSSSKPLSDYLKYIGKGFVLLTRTCYYDSSWKTVAAPTMGVYRTKQSKRCFKFDTNVNPTEIQGSNSQTSKTSTLTRVRYIHTITTD